MANEIKMNGYTVEMSTAGTVAKAMETLPVYQTIRGSEQWSKDKREQLVRDIIAGNYIPPIVYAVEVDPETGEKRLVIVDGQQRGRSIADAVKAGTLDPEALVLVAVDNKREGSEVFRLLNIGSPVGSALVTAVSLEGTAGKALLAVAEHRALSLIPWTAIQGGRTEKAAFAASVLAICAKWAFPESSTKACEAWLKDNGELVTDEVRDKALGVMDTLAEALQSLVDVANGEDKGRAKVARRALGVVRKKNNFLTLVQCILDEYDASDAIALFADAEVWAKGGTYRPTREDGKGRKAKFATIPTGAGSSGNLKDTAARLDAAKYYLDGEGEFAHDIYAALEAERADKAKAKAAEKVVACDVGALEAALGM